MKTSLFVGLKISDTTAITAKRTLNKLGLPVAGVARYIHYLIESDADVYESARACDVLVNANKHTCLRTVEGQGVKILVREGASERLRITLARLGIEAKAVEQGVLWVLDTDRETAERAAKELLHNPHYQTYEVLP